MNAIWLNQDFPNFLMNASVLLIFNNTCAAPSLTSVYLECFLSQIKTFLESWSSIWIKSTLISLFSKDQQCRNTRSASKISPFFALFSRLHTLNLDTVFLAECRDVVQSRATIGQEGITTGLAKEATLQICTLISSVRKCTCSGRFNDSRRLFLKAMSTFIGSGLGPGDDVQHCQPIISFQKLYILWIVRVEMALVSGDEQCALIGANNNHRFQLLCTKFYLITIAWSKGKFIINILLQGILVNIYQVNFNFELKRVSPALIAQSQAVS